MPRTSDNGAGARSAAPAAQRALQILECLSKHGSGLRLAELTRELLLPKSSAHVLLETLRNAGWVDLDESSGKFTLGLTAWEVGQGYAQAKSLVERAKPHMDRICAALHETVRLAILDGMDNVYIANSDGGQALALDTAIGSRLPAYATGLGKVLLADLEPEELVRRVRELRFQQFTQRTIMSLAALQRELEVVRSRGYGEDRGEYVLGVHCVAVAVRDSSGRVAAAMSVSVPSIRFQSNHRKQALSFLLAESSALSRELGAPGQNGSRDVCDDLDSDSGHELQWH